MDLEHIMRSEVSEKDKYWVITLICGIQKESQTHKKNRWLPWDERLGIKTDGVSGSKLVPRNKDRDLKHSGMNIVSSNTL